MAPQPLEAPEATPSDKRRALVLLRERYGEAREHGSSTEGHTNLEWILRTRAGSEGLPGDFDRKRIAIAALWLEDLASELELRVLPSVSDGADTPSREERVRYALAASLRAASDGFLRAFRLPVPER